jgi:hypothetical protein
LFEIIGLLFAILLGFGLSCLIGGLYALLAWFLIRSKRPWPRSSILIAAALPPVFAAYILLCTIIFSVFVPGQSGMLFGDNSEALPNGYSLEVMSELGNYAMILSKQAKDELIVHGHVQSIAVEGPQVFGAYSEPVGSKRYFVLDTSARSVVDFDTLNELHHYVGHPIRLEETLRFQSREPSQLWQLRIERVILFGPPGVCSLLYFFYLLRNRGGNIPAKPAQLNGAESD